ncbi:MAG: MFS transporter [Bacteroidales bacterium]|nr:MFS transporter [Bacteroidales bacterium]MCF8389261.1 MFS transporter [Bacteroidales bacterium]
MSGFLKQSKSFPGTFWAANTLELFERWAYYGIFNLLALYLTNSTESGALGFTQVEKGMIMGIVNAILYFLPVITGSIADKFGYKKVLVLAFGILASGYYFMGMVSSFTSVFITFFYVAIGAALFKPIISATIAKTTNDENASLGFGIFYMIVNIGGLIGPVLASELREISWNYIFLMSSASIVVNMIIVLFFYKEPDRTMNSDSLSKSLKIVFQNIFNVLKDLRFTLFLVIIIGAWTVYWQYFYSLPVFIEQWTDTSALYNSLFKLWPGFAMAIGTDEGIILAEKIIALDAFLIVIFQVIISTFISRFRPMHSMTAGILINSLGLCLAAITRNPFFLLSSIFIFSVGEMIFSPKILEYIGKIAPNDKAALYMGTQFLPIAFGNFIGGFISGGVYDNLANRTRMTRDLLGINTDFELSLDQLSAKAMEELGMNYQELTDHLWNLNHPGKFGIVLAGLGLTTFIALIIYDKYFFTKKA